MPPLGYPEAVGQLCLFPWVPEVQVHGAVDAWAVSGTGPLQDPSGTGVFLVPGARLDNSK